MDSKNYSRGSASGRFSDRELRQFLLAQLTGSNQIEFESALFSDPQLLQRVRLAEIDLTDDYAFGRLRGKEQSAFREKFLVSSGRRNALAISRALHEQAAGASARLAFSSSVSSRAVRLLRHPVWRFAFASLILALILAGAWLVTKEPQFVRRIIPLRLRPAASSTPTPEVANHRADSGAAPSHQDEPPQSPEHEVGVQTFVLRQSKEAPATLIVSAGTVSVRFELEVEHSMQTAYRADLISAGTVIYTAPQIFAAHGSGRISVHVPATVLRPGDFQIRLTQLADNGLVASYYLRVK